jgi:hypothetical protein
MLQKEEDGWERAANVFKTEFVCIRLTGDCGSCGSLGVRGLLNPNECRHRQSIANNTSAPTESDIRHGLGSQAEEASSKAGDKYPGGYKRRGHKGFYIVSQI